MWLVECTKVWLPKFKSFCHADRLVLCHLMQFQNKSCESTWNRGTDKDPSGTGRIGKASEIS